MMAKQGAGRAAGSGRGAAVWLGRLVLGAMLATAPLLFSLPGAGAAAEEVPAQVREDVGDLAQTMRIAEIIEVLRNEGIDYGKTLEEDMFAGAGGPGWEATVARIYDVGTMQRSFEAGLARELARNPAGLPDMQTFFSSELGQKVLRLEIEARRALLDDATEEAAKLAWDDLAATDEGRVALLERFVAANDLLESNVMGALNANLAFYQGMAEGGAFGGEMTEDQMLADVWGQEDQVREQVAEWLYPYLSLAYGPLTDEELETYIAYSESKAGQQLNAALFAAFDDVFSPVSKALGLAVARELQGQDI